MMKDEFGKSTSTIYSNTGASIRGIDQAAAKLAMGISEFRNKKYIENYNPAGLVNCRLDKDGK